MTTLEIILIGILWIIYGIYSLNVTLDTDKSLWYNALYAANTSNFDHPITMFLLYIVFSPIVFICKALYGAFKQYE